MKSPEQSAQGEPSCPLVVELPTESGNLKIPLNTVSPVFDTKLFQGKILLLHRQHDKDWPYMHLFQGKKRNFEIQVQGRFKKPFTSKLWLGNEVAEPMKIGVVARSVAYAILAFMKRVLGSSPRCSFGQSNRGGYMYYPAAVLCNIVLATPPGVQPPGLGTEELLLQEGTGDRKNIDHLLLSIDPDKWDEGYIFTFTYHSMYVDLLGWQLVNLPTGNVSLDTLYGQTRYLRFMMFTAKKGHEEDTGSQEIIWDTHWRWVGATDGTSNDASIQQSSSLQELPDILRKESQSLLHRNAKSKAHEATSADDSSADSDHAGNDADEDCASWFSLDLQSEGDVAGEHTCLQFDSVEATQQKSAGPDSDYAFDSRPNSCQTPAETSISVPWYVETLDSILVDRLAVWYVFEWPSPASSIDGDRSYCICHVDKVIEVLNTHRAGDGSSSSAPVSQKSRFTTLNDVPLPLVDKQKPFRFTVQALEYVRHSASSALSQETTRQELLRSSCRQSLGSLLSSDGTKDCTLVKARELFADAKQSQQQTIHEGLVGAVHFEGRICLELLQLSDDGVLYSYGTRASFGARLALPLAEILDVCAVPRVSHFSMGALGDLFFFEIHTAEKVMIFGASTQEETDDWRSRLSCRLSAAPLAWPGIAGSLCIDIASERHSFGDNTQARRWHPQRRLVLNDRRLLLRSEIQQVEQSPVDLSAHMLSMALAVHAHLDTITARAHSHEAALPNARGYSHTTALPNARSLPMPELEKRLDELADKVCLLKYVQLTSLPPLARLVFWLNTYHCLLLHGFLLFGAPKGFRELMGFHNHVSYIVAAQPFSLVEIEHGILRARMSKPVNSAFFRLILAQWHRDADDPVKRAGCLFHSQWNTRPTPNVLSQSAWEQHFGLGISDSRINYCLNCGTMSCLDEIPVFCGDEAMLEQQLEYASHRFLDTFTEVQKSTEYNTTVLLPYICKRYRKSFTDSQTSAEWLRSLSKYLSPNKAGLITQKPSSCRFILRFDKYDWSTRSRLRCMQFPDYQC